MTEKFEVGTLKIPEFDAVEEFTPPQNMQPHGGVTEVPLAGKLQRWGVELLWAHTQAYTGKILFRRGDPSYKGRVQYHLNKDETFYLLSGRCLLRWDKGDGKLTVEKIGPGRSFHIPRYARHSIIALEDCIFLEVSTPHFDDRKNVDSDYVTEDYLRSDPTWTGEDEAGREASDRRKNLAKNVLTAIGAADVEVV